MQDLSLIGDILIQRQEGYTDDMVTQNLKKRGWSETDILTGMDKIDNGFIFSINSIAAMTPLAPVTYNFGIRRIQKVTNMLYGLIRDTQDVGIKIIDSVQVQKGLVDASVSILQSERDPIIIRKITRGDAEKIRTLYAYVIEAQRKGVINVSED